MKVAAIWTLAASAIAFAALMLPKGAGAQEKPRAETASVAMSAADAFEKGMGSATVMHDLASGGVCLYDCTLLENDGDAAGSDAKWVAEDEQTPMFKVTRQVRVRKFFTVERPEAKEAILYVRPGRAAMFFNGKPVDTSRGSKFFSIPSEWVKKGANELVISTDSETGVGIKLALRRHIEASNPSRKGMAPTSFSSVDGGKTWQPLDGELTIRLHLTQYPAEGSFTSPVIDLAKTEADPLGLTPAAVQAVSFKPKVVTPAGTGVSFLVRAGDTPVYDAKRWSEFTLAGQPLPQGKRYAQWKAVLRTADARVTPVVREVAMEAAVNRADRPAWAAAAKVKDFRNEEIRYTSMPFEYEDPANPKMQALREKYKLADIIKDAPTELEKIVWLRDWVAHQWRFKGPEGHYPAWDADEIMTRKTGMCVQYAITLIQCATSLGYPARYVCGYHEGTMGTAHEVTEIWSNEYRKWVFMDPTTSRNEYAADPKTGVPLSMLELHDRMVKHYYGDKPALYENRPRDGKWSSNIALARGKSTTLELHTESDAPPKDKWPSWTKWLMLCWVPRNNWYAAPDPLPRHQGWNNWDWTGFWQWNDAQAQRDLRYSRFMSRCSDVEWTINQVCFGARYGDETRTISVDMGTVTPNFETFLVKTDAGEWKPSADRVTWKLHPGGNRLEMRVRNTSGVLGPVSHIALEL